MKKYVFLSVVFLLLLQGFGFAQSSDEETPVAAEEPSTASDTESADIKEDSDIVTSQDSATEESTEITEAPAADTEEPQLSEPVQEIAENVENTESPAPVQESAVFESTHFAVRSDLGTEEAQNLANKLEAYLKAFNDYFRFDLDGLNYKLRVKIYNDKATYDRYLQRLINETRDDFVYLHYNDKVRSELVGYQNPEVPMKDSGLIHQAFIQYLRAFVSNPPLWIREGFAVYFENLAYNPETGEASLNQNLSWLETSKDLLYGTRSAEFITLDNLLKTKLEEARENITVFYPEAWALVHYLAMSSNKAHNRILWDSIRLMDADSDLESNDSKIAEAFAWEDQGKLKESLVNYFKAKKTFRELVLDGVDFYAAGKLSDAQDSFSKALELQDSNYIPYYYLGLIQYDKSAFDKAEEYYKKALDKGANKALTLYALGVNAFADNQYEKASSYLKETESLDASYTDKVKELFERMDV